MVGSTSGRSLKKRDELIFVQNIDSQGEDQPKIFLVATIDEQSLKYFYDTQIENGLAAISFNHESFRFIGIRISKCYPTTE